MVEEAGEQRGGEGFHDERRCERTLCSHVVGELLCPGGKPRAAGGIGRGVGEFLLCDRLSQTGVCGVEEVEAPTPVRGRVGVDEACAGHLREHELFRGEASQQVPGVFLGPR